MIRLPKSRGIQPFDSLEPEFRQMIRALVTSACVVVFALMLASCNNSSAVHATIGPLGIASGPPPNGTVGTTYSFELVSTGGVGETWSWSASPGSKLPPGLDLMCLVLTPPGQGCNGLITGKPTTPGTYSVVVTLTDFESPPQHASATYSITIAP
jgi:hypothetical protein